ARVGGLIEHVVNPPWLEAAVERHGQTIGEAPARAGNHLPLRRRLVSNGHDVLWRIRLERQIPLMIAIGQRRRWCPLVQNEIPAHKAEDALAVVRDDSTGLANR